MADNSKIEWCDATWNPTVGCSVLSPGCKRCYAMKLAGRLEAMGSPIYRGHTLKTDSGYVWNGKLALTNYGQLTKPLTWKRPRRIFVNSMSDLFHEALDEQQIAQVFNVMADCPQHTFQVLTKRAGRMRHIMDGPKHHDLWSPKFWHRSILPNVWFGASVEDRPRKERLDSLRETPAAVRFLSLEPLLEDLGELDLRGIGWVIAGAESGPGARRCDLNWIRDIRDQCESAGVPFFFKQHTERGRTISLPTLDGRRHAEFPEVRPC